MRTIYSTSAMTAEDLHAKAGAVYGSRWQSQIARDMGIALRSVQRWARDGIEKKTTAAAVEHFLEQRRVAKIAPPPENTTSPNVRDAACYEAISPGVTAIMAAGRDTGWGEAELTAALLARVVDEMRSIAGADPTRRALNRAARAVSD